MPVVYQESIADALLSVNWLRGRQNAASSRSGAYIENARAATLAQAE